MSVVGVVLLNWFLFIPIAILNGVTREKVYKPYTTDLSAHQISTVIASVAFLALSYFIMRKYVINLNTQQLFLIGFSWVFMTITFEFGFGHYVDGASWQKLLQDYNLFKGHVWSVFLFVVFITPYILKKIQ